MSDMDGYQPTECRDCGLELCACPSDLEAPERCLHGVEMGPDAYCAQCAVGWSVRVTTAADRAMRRVEAWR